MPWNARKRVLQRSSLAKVTRDGGSGRASELMRLYVPVLSALLVTGVAYAGDYYDHIVVRDCVRDGNVDLTVNGNSHLHCTFNNVARFDLGIDESELVVIGNASQVVMHSVDGQSTVRMEQAHIGSVEVQKIDGQSRVYVNIVPGGTLTVGDMGGGSKICFVHQNPPVTVRAGNQNGGSQLIGLDSGQSC